MSITTVLNIIFIIIGAIYALIYFVGKRGSPEERTVTDPVCGKEMKVKNATVCYLHEETIYYFENEECRSKFKKDPQKYIK